MNRSYSIPQWHQMALEGNAPPVRILLHGSSMFPLIRVKRDYVTVVQPEEIPVRGDIVLFSDPGRTRYVVHRVWAVKDGEVLTWGDNCLNPDGWLSAESVWGKIVLIERGGWKIKPDPRKGICWAVFWHHAGKGYRLCQKVKRGVFHRIRKLKSCTITKSRE